MGADGQTYRGKTDRLILVKQKSLRNSSIKYKIATIRALKKEKIYIQISNLLMPSAAPSNRKQMNVQGPADIPSSVRWKSLSLWNLI